MGEPQNPIQLRMQAAEALSRGDVPTYQRLLDESNKLIQIPAPLKTITPTPVAVPAKPTEVPSDYVPHAVARETEPAVSQARKPAPPPTAPAAKPFVSDVPVGPPTPPHLPPAPGPGERAPSYNDETWGQFGTDAISNIGGFVEGAAKWLFEKASPAPKVYDRLKADGTMERVYEHQGMFGLPGIELSNDIPGQAYPEEVRTKVNFNPDGGGQQEEYIVPTGIEKPDSPDKVHDEIRQIVEAGASKLPKTTRMQPINVATKAEEATTPEAKSLAEQETPYPVYATDGTNGYHYVDPGAYAKGLKILDPKKWRLFFGGQTTQDEVAQQFAPAFRSWSNNKDIGITVPVIPLWVDYEGKGWIDGTRIRRNMAAYRLIELTNEWRIAHHLITPTSEQINTLTKQAAADALAEWEGIVKDNPGMAIIDMNTSNNIEFWNGKQHSLDYFLDNYVHPWSRYISPVPGVDPIANALHTVGGLLVMTGAALFSGGSEHRKAGDVQKVSPLINPFGYTTVADVRDTGPDYLAIKSVEISGAWRLLQTTIGSIIGPPLIDKNIKWFSEEHIATAVNGTFDFGATFPLWEDFAKGSVSSVFGNNETSHTAEYLLAGTAWLGLTFADAGPLQAAPFALRGTAKTLSGAVAGAEYLGMPARWARAHRLTMGDKFLSTAADVEHVADEWDSMAARADKLGDVVAKPEWDDLFKKLDSSDHNVSDRIKAEIAQAAKMGSDLPGNVQKLQAIARRTAEEVISLREELTSLKEASSLDGARIAEINRLEDAIAERERIVDAAWAHTQEMVRQHERYSNTLQRVFGPEHYSDETLARLGNHLEDLWHTNQDRWVSIKNLVEGTDINLGTGKLTAKAQLNNLSSYYAQLHSIKEHTANLFKTTSPIKKQLMESARTAERKLRKLIHDSVMDMFDHLNDVELNHVLETMEAIHSTNLEMGIVTNQLDIQVALSPVYQSQVRFMVDHIKSDRVALREMMKVSAGLNEAMHAPVAGLPLEEAISKADKLKAGMRDGNDVVAEAMKNINTQIKEGEELLQHVDALPTTASNVLRRYAQLLYEAGHTLKVTGNGKSLEEVAAGIFGVWTTPFGTRGAVDEALHIRTIYTPENWKHFADMFRYLFHKMTPNGAALRWGVYKGEQYKTIRNARSRLHLIRQEQHLILAGPEGVQGLVKYMTTNDPVVMRSSRNSVTNAAYLMDETRKVTKTEQFFNTFMDYVQAEVEISVFKKHVESLARTYMPDGWVHSADTATKASLDVRKAITDIGTRLRAGEITSVQALHEFNEKLYRIARRRFNDAAPGHRDIATGVAEAVDEVEFVLEHNTKAFGILVNTMTHGAELGKIIEETNEAMYRHYSKGAIDNYNAFLTGRYSVVNNVDVAHNIARQLGVNAISAETIRRANTVQRLSDELVIVGKRTIINIKQRRAALGKEIPHPSNDPFIEQGRAALKEKLEKAVYPGRGNPNWDRDLDRFIDDLAKIDGAYTVLIKQGGRNAQAIYMAFERDFIRNELNAFSHIAGSFGADVSKTARDAALHKDMVEAQLEAITIKIANGTATDAEKADAILHRRFLEKYERTISDELLREWGVADIDEVKKQVRIFAIAKNRLREFLPDIEFIDGGLKGIASDAGKFVYKRNIADKLKKAAHSERVEEQLAKEAADSAQPMYAVDSLLQRFENEADLLIKELAAHNRTIEDTWSRSVLALALVPLRLFKEALIFGVAPVVNFPFWARDYMGSVYQIAHEVGPWRATQVALGSFSSFLPGHRMRVLDDMLRLQGEGTRFGSIIASVLSPHVTNIIHGLDKPILFAPQFTYRQLGNYAVELDVFDTFISQTFYDNFKSYIFASNHPLAKIWNTGRDAQSRIAGHLHYVQQRMRVELFTREFVDRANKLLLETGVEILTEAQARQVAQDAAAVVKHALYDWGHPLNTVEASFLANIFMFYRYNKLAIGQAARSMNPTRDMNRPITNVADLYERQRRLMMLRVMQSVQQNGSHMNIPYWLGLSNYQIPHVEDAKTADDELMIASQYFRPFGYPTGYLGGSPMSVANSMFFLKNQGKDYDIWHYSLPQDGVVQASRLLVGTANLLAALGAEAVDNSVGARDSKLSAYAVSEPASELASMLIPPLREMTEDRYFDKGFSSQRVQVSGGDRLIFESIYNSPGTRAWLRAADFMQFEEDPKTGARKLYVNAWYYSVLKAITLGQGVVIPRLLDNYTAAPDYDPKLASRIFMLAAIGIKVRPATPRYEFNKRLEDRTERLRTAEEAGIHRAEESERLLQDTINNKQ